jgi:hypothetical protein
MFGIFLLYFIGKAFYTLAQEHQKNKWGFAIAGVVSYYAGIIIGEILIALVYELVLNGSVDSISDIALSLMALPIGIASCWGLYTLLKRNWSKSTITTNNDALDGEIK